MHVLINSPCVGTEVETLLAFGMSHKDFSLVNEIVIWLHLSDLEISGLLNRTKGIQFTMTTDENLAGVVYNTTHCPSRPSQDEKFSAYSHYSRTDPGANDNRIASTTTTSFPEDPASKASPESQFLQTPPPFRQRENTPLATLDLHRPKHVRLLHRPSLLNVYVTSAFVNLQPHRHQHSRT